MNKGSAETPNTERLEEMRAETAHYSREPNLYPARQLAGDLVRGGKSLEHAIKVAERIYGVKLPDNTSK